jgi:hypothetical protein
MTLVKIWNSSKRSIFAARKSPKIVKNLFDATPYSTTTSDPKLRFSKNITGFEPRDLIGLDSFAGQAEDRFSDRHFAAFQGTLIEADLRQFDSLCKSQASNKTVAGGKLPPVRGLE